MAGDKRAIADALPETIQQIFKSFYVIPDFQRPYVWSKKQVHELLKDIRDEHRENGSEGTHYFLGSIVVYSDQPETFSLVDGQQRLTTLYILFCAIRDRLKQVDKSNDDVVFLQNCIVGGAVGRGGVTISKPRVRVEYERDQLVLTAIGEAKTKNLGIKKKEPGRHLVEAYEAALDYLVEEFGEDVGDLRDYAYFLLTKVEIIKIVTIDFLRALVIFERINDRGLGLNAMDLLKNLLFKMSGSEDHAAIANGWHDVINTLRKGGEKNNMRFLRYFLAANYDLESDKVVKADDVFEWFMKHKDVVGIGKRTSAFVSKLKDGARAYVNILHGSNIDGSPSEPLLGIVAQRSAVRQHIPVLMSARKLKQADFNRLAEHMEMLCVVFALTSSQWNELEKVGPAWCRRLRDIESEGDLTQFLGREFKSLVKDKIPDALDQLNRTNDIRPSLLKYIIARMAHRLDMDCGKKGANALDHYFSKDVTIEHVLPQALPVDAVMDGFHDVETAKRYVYRLGNLTVLHKSPNSVASDEPFSRKRRVYERSDFELTKALVTDLEIGQKTKYGEASRAYGLHPFSTWTRESVDERQKQMLAIAKRVWGF